MRPFGLIGFLLILTSGVVHSETVHERIARDGIVMVEADDPGMTAAIRRAQQTLPDFLALARKRPRATSHFAVKVAVIDGDEVEYFWITPFKEGGGKFSGQIDNEPRLVNTVKFGQTITFVEGEIVDWMYMAKGRMQGNFTLCVLLQRESKDQADTIRKHYGLTCNP